MSRHDGHKGRGMSVFQLVIVDYSKQADRFKINRSKWVDNSPRPHYVGDSKAVAFAPHKTLVERFKDYKAAMTWGRKFGTVISCHKVDIGSYLKNIEHLNISEKVIKVSIDEEEYVVNRAQELSRPRIEIQDKDFDIDK